MLTVFSNFLKQSFFLESPALTEVNLPDQTGQVVIITGYVGIAYDLAHILYKKNATVYFAGRDLQKAQLSIRKMKESTPSSNGRLEFMKVDLADLPTIKPGVESFLLNEKRLDKLINNAGVMFPPVGSKSAQGHELQMATNCLGHFLLTELLTPLLTQTAVSAPVGSVRIAWAGSSGIDGFSPKGGITFDDKGVFMPHKTNNQTNYGMSKTGNYFFAREFARRNPVNSDGKGVVSVAFNPGNLRTELQRHSPVFLTWLVDKIFLYPAIYGAYTELWAGWNSDTDAKTLSGAYIWPWGKMGCVCPDIEAEVKADGNSERFWNWCKSETQAFV